MLRSSGPSDEMGSGVLDGLQPLEQLTNDAGVVHTLLQSRDKTKTKTLTSKTEAKAKAVKICLEAASRQGTASRHHITGSVALTWSQAGVLR